MLTITSLSAQQIMGFIDELCEVLKVTVDLGASIGWVAPIDPADARSYWENVQSQVKAGTKVLIAALEDNQLVGSVQLGLEPRQNGNHRAEVQKLMVHPDYRKQGIARQLMQALDVQARSMNLTLLVLDVRKGDAAESLYQQQSFIHVGDIPQYARSSNNKLDATAFYYKLLS